MTTVFKERLRWKADVLMVHSVTNCVRRYQLSLKDGNDSIMLDLSKEQYDSIAAVITNSQNGKDDLQNDTQQSKVKNKG